MDAATLHELKTALEEEHDRLIGELKTIARPDPRMRGNWNASFPQFEEAESGSHASREEEGDEVEEFEVRLEAEHSLESRLLSVTLALERIQRKTYGSCTKCGQEMSPERLKANPAAEFCVTHGEVDPVT